MEWDLSARAQDEPSIYIEVAQDNVWLYRRVLRVRSLASRLNDDLRFRESAGDIPGVDIHIGDDVVCGVVDPGRVLLIVDDWSIRAKSLVERENRGKLLVLDLDQLQRFGCDIFRLRGNGGNTIPDEAYLGIEDA